MTARQVEEPQDSLINEAFDERNELSNLLAQVTSFEQQLQCDVCKEKMRKLKKHLMAHSYKKPRSCSECGEKFFKSSDFKKHMMIHTGEEPFSCSDILCRIICSIF